MVYGFIVIGGTAALCAFIYASARLAFSVVEPLVERERTAVLVQSALVEPSPLFTCTAHEKKRIVALLADSVDSGSGSALNWEKTGSGSFRRWVGSLLCANKRERRKDVINFVRYVRKIGEAEKRRQRRRKRTLAYHQYELVVYKVAFCLYECPTLPSLATELWDRYVLFRAGAETTGCALRRWHLQPPTNGDTGTFDRSSCAHLFLALEAAYTVNSESLKNSISVF
jgi:hypothetical protein